MVRHDHHDSSDQETWDKKKIFLFALIVIFGLIGTGYAYIRWYRSPQTKVQGVSVKANEGFEVTDTSRKSYPKTSIQEGFKADIEEKLELVKQEVNKLDLVEVASSSPQVQKILKDIQTIENFPKNQAKEACFNICKNL